MIRVKKIAAVLLAAVLLIQHCSVAGLAAETQTETQAEAQTVAESEAETQTQAIAESEVQTATEAQATEAQTQTATEAQATEAQTQAVTETQATEAQTQAATETQTQAATEAQATEAQTQAVTEAQATEAQTQATEAQATEAQTQSTESQTQSSETSETGTTEASKETDGDKTAETTADTETETETEAETETETETETERSERVNTGSQLKLLDLKNRLAGALPWLFVAKDLTIPEEVSERLEETLSEEQTLDELILKDSEGEALLDGLANVSLEMANAQSVDTVTVINIYADAEGNLDETQLEALFADKILDVTDRTYVVNVIADSKAQELSFAGYALKQSGQLLDYEDTDEAGAVLYNFASIDGDTYTDYEGTLKLSGNLQGTFLAPKATVEMSGNLAGAIYARTVIIKNADAELLRIVFQAEKSETETETESETETETESETETETETETESETEAVTETETEVETETETEAVTESAAEVETEAVTETETDDGIMLAAEAGASSATNESEVLTAATESTTGDENLTNVTQDRSVTVSAQTLYGKTVLTAEKEVTYYAALFTGTGTEQTIVSDVKTLTFAAGDTSSESITFDSLAAGTYYVAATDEAGNLLQTTETLNAPIVEVTLAEADTSKSAVLQYLYTAAWPEDTFSYSVKLSVTLNVLDRAGKALTGKEKFYANIYSDADKTTLVNTSPIAFSMAGSSTKTKTYTLKATKPQQTFYIAETDSSGAAVVGGENGFAYVVSYDASDAVTIKCGDTEAAVTIQNKLNDSTIKIRVENASTGKLLSGATLAVKDSSGNIYEVEAAGGKTFASGTTELVWTNALTDGETYYLTEITAPSGYTPIPDVSFTVVRGCTTEVVLQNTQTVSTSYALTATKEVYVGDYQVYAYNTSGTSGNYTFYAALFSDAAHTKKVSDVVSMQVSGFTGSVTFSNLTQGGVYYLAETDEYGIVQSSTDALTIRYTNSGEVKMSQTTQSVVIQNVYASLPSGYRYTGTLTFTLNVTDSSGTAEAVTDTFYAGIFRSADYSDTPTVVQLDLQNASTVSVRRRILLSGESDMTYYIAEVDSTGNRITDSSDFSYTVTVDNPTVTIAKGSNQTVTITNKAKSTKATLYITKRVYDGSSLLAVSETFYAGLFKDAELTELYADPIALNLENESEKTLKLTLNLGSASGVTVYVAEVDKDGNVIEDQSSFGYQIKIVNATAGFTQDNLEIQTVLLNSVYGTTSDDDWDDIMYSTSSDLYDDDSYYSVGDNGSISDDDDSVQTGDNTPLTGWLVLLCGAFAVFAWELRRTKKTLE